MNSPPPVLRRFHPGVIPPNNESAPAFWFVFRNSDLLIRGAAAGQNASIPLAGKPEDFGVVPLRALYLGQLDGTSCFAVETAPAATAPVEMEFVGLRQAFGVVDEATFWVAARAVQLVEWERTHQFCGRCGKPTVQHATERAKECPACRLLQFPRISPAVIVSVERGDELLLARSARFPAGMYSVIAGFVETGETLEQAVQREVREEVGLAVADLRYFASQPWPFPHSLMIAFTTVYAGGDLRIDTAEIEDAQWFRADRLPALPGPLSVSRKLIDHFLARHNKA
jgi:NAD+ diphosphatase